MAAPTPHCTLADSMPPGPHLEDLKVCPADNDELHAADDGGEGDEEADDVDGPQEELVAALRLVDCRGGEWRGVE